MIKKLQLVLTETNDGEVVVKYAGKDRARALEIYEKAQAEEDARLVCYYRQPLPRQRVNCEKVRAYHADRSAERAEARTAEQEARWKAGEEAARANASAAAIELAEENDVALQEVGGTGKEGRVILADVKRHLGEKEEDDSD